MVVKPRTSLNRMVMRRSSPPSTSFSGDLRELLDQRRRQIEAEGGADLLALLLLAEIVDEGEHQIDQPASRSADR